MSRGYVQNLLNSAASFASCVLHFSEVVCLNEFNKIFGTDFEKSGVLFS